eukprot:5995439-Pleurochrysis_carterae.AAC.1
MSVSPVSVQLEMSPSDGENYPRVVLKLKHPSQVPSDSDACQDGGRASAPLNEVEKLKRELAESKAAVSQLRSSLRSSNMSQRMLGAQ